MFTCVGFFSGECKLVLVKVETRKAEKGKT